MVRSLIGVALVVAGCVTPLTPAPLSQPVTGYVIFFKNGAILGTLGALQAECDHVRQADLERRTPGLERVAGVTPAKARALLEGSWACTPFQRAS